MPFRRLGSGPQSNYITRAGYKTLCSEVDHLLRVERPRVTQQVADAAAMGDRSENAEYIYGKKRLREIDKRVRYLSKRIDELVVVDPSPSPDGRIRFGAYVAVEDDDGEEHEFRIVGPDEFDPATRQISLDSPVAKALMGKRVDEEVTVVRPKGDVTYVIVGVRY